MMWSVVVPSRHDAAVVEFVRSLIASHPDVTPDQIIIVDDGLSGDTRSLLDDVTFVGGAKPFIFGRAVNMGAAAEPERDIVVCGDDVRFMSKGLIDKLSSRSAGLAAISPEVIGLCGVEAQRCDSRASETPWLAFICVYIPRPVWDATGGLDERYVGYGFDDMDWCVRASEYGPLRVDHSLRVVHLEYASSFRKRPDWQGLYEQNLGIFKAKWGKIESAA
jgi:hypothetical protein